MYRNIENLQQELAMAKVWQGHFHYFVIFFIYYILQLKVLLYGLIVLRYIFLNLGSHIYSSDAWESRHQHH